MKLLTLFNQVQTVANGNETDYIFLSTRWEDVLMAIGGLVISILLKWAVDNSRFENKIKEASEDQVNFYNKYKQDASYYINNQKWSWKIWWQDNDQHVIPTSVVGVILIFAVPEAFINLIGEWNALYSIMVGVLNVSFIDSLKKKFLNNVEKLP